MMDFRHTQNTHKHTHTQTRAQTSTYTHICICMLYSSVSSFTSFGTRAKGCPSYTKLLF